MAVWDKITSQGNVEDRRGMRSVGVAGGGIGLTGLVVILLFNYLAGGDIGDVLSQVDTSQVVQTESYDVKDFEGEDTYEVFVSKVLGSANDIWSQAFAKSGLVYHEPKLVLFRSLTESACGGASSEVGPHYCPYDRTIYLDETFFDELTKKLGAKGGDVAEAYVIAHEVGHHIQNELNALEDSTTNQESINIELQADCYAGIWANSIKELGVFEQNEIQEAMDAAAAVGDDRIQSKVKGRINPETWTHGSSAARVAAFAKGYSSGDVKQCNY